MLYNYIKEHYKEAEPIFFSDLEREDITKSALNQQLKKLCDKGLLQKYDTGVYFIPKKSLLNSTIGPNADMVARYRFISKGDNVDGFYGGNSFANQIGITTQVPRVVEIVSNNTNSSDREVRIGNRRFYVRKPIVQITKENVYVLQMLELLKNLDAYLDYSYEEARDKFAEYITIHGIKRSDVDLYIRKYPLATFKFYYELGLDFPGYDKVRVSFTELESELKNSVKWQERLKAVKGVYLITDKSNGKLYVGSTSGEDGIYGRFKTYIDKGYDKDEVEKGEYPNKEFQELVKKKDKKYLRANFQYSILETFTLDTDRNEIIAREQYWKKVLKSKEFGYNAN